MTTKITFTLPAANIIGATECVLLGEFNNWNTEEGIYLTKQPDGSMTAEVELAAGDYQYRYLLSNGRWVNDDAEKVTSEMSGYPVVNCIVRVAAVAEVTTEAPKTSKPKVVKKKAAEVKPKATKAKATAKPVVAADGKDDLTKIEGIGKKIAELLISNNITSFAALSNASADNLKNILATGGSRFSLHNPGTWPKQAKLAADAKWDELKLLQAELKGGK